MGLTLFDFDFSTESIPEHELWNEFLKLQRIYKDHGNAYSKSLEEVPFELKHYLHDFETKGWITFEKDRFRINDEYIAFHTVNELARDYQEKMDNLLSSPNVCWYNDGLNLRNFSGPYRYKNEEEKEEFYKLKSDITKKAAIKLGLQHFLEVPSSRGSKMNPISSKWAIENVLPTIAKFVISITDYHEMKEFFNKHTFFFGRRDWDWGKSNIAIAPYPEFKSFHPTEFDTACLCEARDEKTIKLIFDYMGCSYGAHNLKKKIIYPEGWSMVKYEESLTEEDRELIKKDQERLKRLHSNSR